MYLLKLALRPWRVAPFSQMFSAIAVGFLLLLVGFLFWLQFGLKTVLVRLQSEQVVTAYVESSVAAQDETQLVDSIRLALGAKGVGSPEIKMTTVPQFVALLKNQYPDLARELEDLGQEMYQVIPRFVSVSGILPDAALEKVKGIRGIEYAESSKDRYHHIVGAFSTLRWVARVLIFGLCLALLTGLIHLSRMNAYLHRDALILLRFWGASNTVLATPEMISGLLVGLLGGLISFGGWITLGVWLARHLSSLSVMLNGMPQATMNLAGVLLAAGAILGTLAGVLGTLSPSHLSSHEGARV